jgi:dGTPase
MQWDKLLNAKRLGDRPARNEPGRSPFISDHDKIIFSGAFRRLAKKTQVHPLATNDHIHNRLTHSLEVSCVGRSLGVLVGQKLRDESKISEKIEPTYIGDIVQSACLAHDIGNPPFGHTGEEAIRSWFRNEGSEFMTDLSPREVNDLQSFEGNAQGLRVLTTVENHIYEGGLRLTYATLGSYIKYPWTSLPSHNEQRPKKNKFGVYTSELKLFHEIASALGIKAQPGDDWYCRHPLVHLMESADDFCYGILDLEDGLEMNILKWDDVYDILKPVIPKERVAEIEANLAKVRCGRKTPLLRGVVIDAYVKAASDAFVKHEEKYRNGDPTSLIDLCEENVKKSVSEAKNVANDIIFKHQRKIELEIGAYNVMTTLLRVLSDAAIEWTKDPKKMSFRSQRAIDLIGQGTFHPSIRGSEKCNLSPNYLALMRVVDFVSGMTDNYATFLAKQFNGMGI